MTGNPGAFLPYGHQLVEDDDIAAVAEALRGDFLTTGPLVAGFEKAFAERLGAKFAVTCNSGTAALHLATLARGLGAGDAAVVPSITFLATANAVRFVGAEVVFADVDPETGLMTPDTLRAALKRAKGATIKAVLPVHLGGMVVDMEAIAEVAAAAGLAVIEDACHALGSTEPAGMRVGACRHSLAAAFSTHPVKAITTGEGGVLTTNDEALARGARILRSHGMEHDAARWVEPAAGMEAGKPAPWYYEMAAIGYNYRLTDVACALGLSQLKKLDRFIARRSALAARYDHLLAPLTPHVRPPGRSPGQPGWHLYAVRIDFAGAGVTRGDVMRALRTAGIGSQVLYIPVHRQPYYRARYGDQALPGADRYYQTTLALPLFPGMADSDVDRVVATLAAALKLA